FADLDETAELGADYIQYMIKYAMEKCAEELAFLEQRYEKGRLEKLNHVAKTPFKKITYTEAVENLQNAKKKFEYKVEWGSDLQPEHERFLTDHHCKGPGIVTDYPNQIKAFYMKQKAGGTTVR